MIAHSPAALQARSGQGGGGYEFILLDCPPSGGLLAQNALAAADFIIAPVSATNFSIAGLATFYTWVETFRAENVHDAKWLGIVPTQTDPRTRITRELQATFRSGTLPIPVLPEVPSRVGLEDLIKDRAVASAKRVPDIWRAYSQLADHVLSHSEGDRIVILLANHKGGVGKTTTAVNLGTCLAALGHRTLLVDLDHQSHAGRWVLSEEAFDAVDHDLLEVLVNGRPMSEIIVPTLFPLLDLAPSSPNMAAADMVMVQLPLREGRLQRALRNV